MADAGRHARGVRRRSGIIACRTCLVAAIFYAIGGFSCIVTSAQAADLNGVPPPASPLPRLAPQPACRVVPRPQTDIFGNVVRFEPSWVCISRGLYADRLPPPPPEHRPWWWRFWY